MCSFSSYWLCKAIFFLVIDIQVLIEVTSVLSADYMTILCTSICWYWTGIVGVIWKCNTCLFFFEIRCIRMLAMVMVLAVDMMVFMVLSSWHCHCNSSTPGGYWPLDGASWLEPQACPYVAICYSLYQALQAHSLAILHCWQAISTGSGAGTSPPVHTAMVLTRRQSTWCSGVQLMTRPEETSGWEEYSTRIHDASGSSWSGLGRWPSPLPLRPGKKEREPSIANTPADWRWRSGRPRQSWLRTVETDLRPLNLGLATAKRRTPDRAAWRRLVATATSTTTSCWMIGVVNDRCSERFCDLSRKQVDIFIGRIDYDWLCCM